MYEDGAAKLGMTPARYRAGGEGEQIRWSLVDTALGNALVAATERGICMVELGDDPRGAGSEAARRIPAARRCERVDAGRDEFLAPRLRAVADALAGKQAQVPVDLIGTAFQKKRLGCADEDPAPARPAAMPKLAAQLGAAARRARGRQRLRAQPRRDRGAVPSRGPRRRLAGRLPLGPAAQGSNVLQRERAA